MRFIMFFATLAMGCGAESTKLLPPENNVPGLGTILTCNEQERRFDAAPDFYLDAATCQAAFAEAEDAGYDAGTFVPAPWQQ